VYGTVFIATEPHGIPPVTLMGDELEIGSESVSTAEALIQFVPERDHAEPDQSSEAVEDGTRPNAEETGTVERGFEGPGRSRRSKPDARTLGKMEGSQAEQMKGRAAIARFRFSKP
jgi:hypothetical protein